MAAVMEDEHLDIEDLHQLGQETHPPRDVEVAVQAASSSPAKSVGRSDGLRFAILSSRCSHPVCCSPEKAAAHDGNGPNKQQVSICRTATSVRAVWQAWGAIR